MNKPGSDPKVKKTLVRNYEQKSLKKHNDANQNSKPTSSNSGLKRNMRKINLDEATESPLNIPTLCSSEVFAHYLTDATKNLPPPLTIQDQNIDRDKINTKITKKLNFHLNDKMYKNLVELNANAEIQKTKKERRPMKSSGKRDLEPNIDDFSDDEKEKDIIPTIPIPNSKFKPIKKVENGQLHKLISSFEKS